MHLKISSAKRWPFCPRGDEFIRPRPTKASQQAGPRSPAKIRYRMSVANLMSHMMFSNVVRNIVKTDRVLTKPSVPVLNLDQSCNLLGHMLNPRLQGSCYSRERSGGVDMVWMWVGQRLIYNVLALIDWYETRKEHIFIWDYFTLV